MIRVDKEATKAAKFKDARSYVRPNGKRFLFGADKEALRRAVYERSKGYCEMRVQGVAFLRCGRNISWEVMELHHEPPLSKGGDDSIAGTLASCRRCHCARHGRYPKWNKKAGEPNEETRMC